MLLQQGLELDVVDVGGGDERCELRGESRGLAGDLDEGIVVEDGAGGGVDDAGGIQNLDGGNSNRDITLWTTLRDHANMVWYYMVANTPKWERIDLKAVPWASLKTIKYKLMKPGTWWEDATWDSM